MESAPTKNDLGRQTEAHAGRQNGERVYDIVLRKDSRLP